MYFITSFLLGIILIKNIFIKYKKRIVDIILSNKQNFLEYDEYIIKYYESRNTYINMLCFFIGINIYMIISLIVPTYIQGYNSLNILVFSICIFYMIYNVTHQKTRDSDIIIISNKAIIIAEENTRFEKLYYRDILSIKFYPILFNTIIIKLFNGKRKFIGSYVRTTEIYKILLQIKQRKN